ncbi:polyphosphate kinase 2 family protein [Nocardioidaceae bacterium]|nr:polyphosphate kinase 2 family protein [Nocardioidaceae bacterium]
MSASPEPATPFTDALRLPEGRVDLAAIDTRATPAWSEGRDAGAAALAVRTRRVGELQERMWAHGVAGSEPPRVLLVLQGMDTSGKGGALTAATGAVAPMGLHVAAFGRPTSEELAHDFLWRVRRELPGVGQVGVFDRSHYEDVLIAAVRGLAPPEEIERRYGAIDEFEAELTEAGVVVLKVMLHVSKERQAERLEERLTDPGKRWKYDPSDVDERAFWEDYTAAYETVLARCRSDRAPWHVVPAHRKWYRKLAVTSLLLETLEGLGLDWPEPDIDVEAELARLRAS